MPFWNFSKISGITSTTSVSVNFQRNEMAILGTEYAGEMKKGVLTVMMYLMPLRNVLPMHASATVGKAGDVTVFFGLSGTGGTYLTIEIDDNFQVKRLCQLIPRGL